MTSLKFILPALPSRLILPTASFPLVNPRGFHTSSPLPISSSTSKGPWSSPLPPSTSSSLHQYLIVAKDHPDALKTRLSVREEHLAGARQGHQSGRITLGGALLSKDHSKAGQGGQNKAESIIGSVLVVQAESQEEARSLIEADIYSISGIFSSIDVYPFMPASLGTAQSVAAEATAAGGIVKEVAEEAASSLGKLREAETKKWKEAAAKSLEWLRKSQQGKQVS